MMNKLILKSDTRPFVLQIQERLRARIRSGDLKPGDRIPSMRQLAAWRSCCPPSTPSRR